MLAYPVEPFLKYNGNSLFAEPFVMLALLQGGEHINTMPVLDFLKEE